MLVEPPPQVFRAFSNDELLKRVRIPVLLLHGSPDQLLPASHARANFATIPHDRKTLKLIQGAGHNDILGFPEYFPAIAAFLGETPR